MPALPASRRQTGVAWPALLLALTVSLVADETLAAQDRSWPPQYRRERPQLALEGSGMLAQLRGDAVGAATDGAGFEVMASVGVSVISLGGGFQRTTHRVGASDATVDGIFFEPRVALPFVARNFTPFVYGRVSRLDRSLDGARGTRGTGLGAGVGTYLWLAPNVQLSSAVGWNELRFGDPGPDTGFPVVGRTSGRSLMVRAGLVLGFDRWGR